MVKMGYAEADITPQKPVETVGFGREDNISRGILQPLLSQVVIWEDEELYCLVTIDSLGFTKDLSDRLRENIGQMLGRSVNNVMLCFSHCHSAPNAAVETDYYEMVCEKTLKAVNIAGERMHGVSIGYGNAVAEIGVNRRHGNALDKRVGILKVCNAESGTIDLLLFRVTAHCNVLKSDNYMISPDYFGAIREMLEENYGCPIMVVQGSAGNIAPKYFQSEEAPVDARGEQYIRSQTALKDMALEVMNAAVPVIEQIDTKIDRSIQMYSRQFKLYAEVPSTEAAEIIAKEAKEKCGIDGTKWLEEVKRLKDIGIRKQEEIAEVQYFRIGDWCFCGVPYELMVEFANGAQQISQNEFFYLNGYTNGCLTYFPMEEEFDKGGYEVYWSMLLYYSYFGRVFPFERESATKLLEFVVTE